MKTYEGMFLMDAGQSNLAEAVEPIQTVLGRNEAEMVQAKKWDERRLAYDIKGRHRGLYVLTYFKADPARIADIERDVKLSEQILRALILAADSVDEATMQAPTPAESGEHRRDSHRDDRDDRDDRRGAGRKDDERRGARDAGSKEDASADDKQKVEGSDEQKVESDDEPKAENSDEPKESPSEPGADEVKQ